MPLTDHLVPIIGGINAVPSQTGDANHPNASLLCKLHNDALTESESRLANLEVNFPSSLTLPEQNTSISLYLNGTSGDDANDGLSDTTPVATIERIIEIIKGLKWTIPYISIQCSGQFTNPVIDLFNMQSETDFFDEFARGEVQVSFENDFSDVFEVSVDSATSRQWRVPSGVFLGFIGVDFFNTEPFFWVDQGGALSFVFANVEATYNQAKEQFFVSNAEIGAFETNFVNTQANTIPSTFYVTNRAVALLSDCFYTGTGYTHFAEVRRNCFITDLNDNNLASGTGNFATYKLGDCIARLTGFYENIVDWNIDGDPILLCDETAVFINSQGEYIELDYEDQEIRMQGTKVIGSQQTAIPNATSGTEIDTINSILTALRTHGLIAT